MPSRKIEAATASSKQSVRDPPTLVAEQAAASPVYISSSPPDSEDAKPLALEADTVRPAQNSEEVVATTADPEMFGKPSAFQTFLVVLTFVSLFASMIFLRHNPEKSTLNVLLYAWITTASTGVGAVPFYFVTDMSRKWLGVANALAGGMMSAASFGLILEALEEERILAALPGHRDFGAAKVIFGVAIGVGFMLWSKKKLDEHGELEIGNLHGASAQRALLIIGVMTLHSFAEGLAVGVAFGSKSSSSLGFIISSTLAVHNVPEGLAVSLSLVAKGTSAIEATLWSVFSSLPQVIVAVPAFIFVEKFIPLVSIGLGFAAGAMLFVTFHELLREAYDDLESRTMVAGLAAASGLLMMALQYMIDS